MKLTLIFFLCAGCHICVGYNISSCNTIGGLDVTETSASIVTCTEITDDYMFWHFTPSGGTKIQIASCTWSTSTCNITDSDSDYAVNRTQYDTSTLTVRQNLRAKVAGAVRCGGAFNGATATLSTPCNVRVVYPAQQVTNCRTEVDRTDWTVSGSCDVDKIYASDHQYTCRWFHVPPSGQQTSFTGVMELSSFTDNGLQYQRGKCSFSGQLMPTIDGVHVYNLSIDRGEKQFAGQSITIQHPGDPVLSNCPTFVIEGDNVTCSCQTSGSPPAVVTWYGNGVIDSVLVLRNVSRSLDCHNYTCNQYWGGVNSNWRATTYSVQVHYPPSSPPLISGVQDGGHTEGESLSLSCSVTGGQPPVSSVTFWCGQESGDKTDTTTTVNGVTTVTSGVTFDRLDLTMNGTVCPCYAHWSEKPSFYTQTATATITVIAKSSATTAATSATTATSASPSPTGANDQQKDVGAGNSNGDAPPVAAIAGGAAGGLVLIVVIVVVIVIAMRRRKGTPKSAGKEDRKEEDFEEHVNLKYESSEDVRPTHSKPSAVALRLPANPNTHTAPDATNHDTEEETGFGYASLSDSQPEALKGRSHDLDLDADLYSSADGVGDDGGSVSASAASPGRQQKGADEYAFVSKPKPPKKPQPDPAEYAVVDKSRTKRKGSGSQTPENNGDAASPDVYAQVDKSAKRGNSKPSRSTQPEAEGETYAQVNKSAKRGNSKPSRPSQPEAGGETYAQVQKPKPGAKPIPATKPKPATATKPAVLPKPGVLPKPEGQKDNAYDVPPSRKGTPPMVTAYEDVELSNEMMQPPDVYDEYNTLDFGKNAPTESSCDPESQYSHIGAV